MKKSLIALDKDVKHFNYGLYIDNAVADLIDIEIIDEARFWGLTVHNPEEKYEDIVVKPINYIAPINCNTVCHGVELHIEIWKQDNKYNICIIETNKEG